MYKTVEEIAPEAFGEVPGQLALFDTPSTNEAIQPGRFNRATRFIGRNACRLAGVTAGGIIAVSTWGSVKGTVGPVEAECSIEFGTSDISIGALRESTVDFTPTSAPIGAQIQVLDINPDFRDNFTTQAVSSTDPDQLKSTSATQLENLCKKAGLNSLGLFAGGGLLGFGTTEAIRHYALNRNREKGHITKTLAAGGLTSIGLLAVGGGWATATYDSDFLNNPRYSGSMEQAADFVESVLDSRENYARHSEQSTEWLDNLLTIYKNLESAPIDSGNYIRVLVIADDHSLPCAYDQAQSIIDAFDVDFFLHAGDKSEWGQTFEKDLFGGNCKVDNMGQLTISGEFVRGNHDSKKVVDEVDSYPNVEVLDGQVESMTVDTDNGPVDITISGLPDPRFTPNPLDRSSAEEERELVEGLSEDIARNYRRQATDIVVVHDPKGFEQLKENLNDNSEEHVLLVAGHTHKLGLEQNGNVTQLTAGTFGGAGLRGFEHEEHDNRATRQATVLFLDPADLRPAALVDIRLERGGSASARFNWLEKPAETDTEAVNPDN